mmetsp:Transcript_22397/g.55201  ORF Transcript_22397/g.55201 Transcript_22397/m.55201 type:complete len:415 (-) Transcript_22397:2178-3422(-)
MSVSDNVLLNFLKVFRCARRNGPIVPQPSPTCPAHDPVEEFLVHLYGIVFETIVVIVRFLHLSDFAVPLAVCVRRFLVFFRLAKPYCCLDGHCIPYSLVNVSDPDFSTAWYDPTKLFKPTDRFDGPRNVHFAMLCAKLAYEHPDIIRDVVARWGWTWHERFQSPRRDRRLEDRYETSAFVISNEHCVLVVFRGTMPLSLIQWRTDFTLGWEDLDNPPRRVHGGFHRALKDRADRTGDVSIREAIDQVLQGLSDKSIFITGHSMGAALTSVYAHGLDEALRGRVKGVFTFAQPRVGNEGYRDFFDRHYGKKCLRFVNSGDIVPQVPPYRFGYRHHAGERFITGVSGRIVDDPEEICIERENHEDWWFVISLYKMAYSFFAGRFLRLFTRIALGFVTCLSDHFPGDYERPLRRAAL